MLFCKQIAFTSTEQCLCSLLRVVVSLWNIYTNKLRHFANKLQSARTRVTDYTFGISIPEMMSVSYI